MTAWELAGHFFTLIVVTTWRFQTVWQSTLVSAVWKQTKLRCTIFAIFQSFRLQELENSYHWTKAWLSLHWSPADRTLVCADIYTCVLLYTSVLTLKNFQTLSKEGQIWWDENNWEPTIQSLNYFTNNISIQFQYKLFNKCFIAMSLF